MQHLRLRLRADTIILLAGLVVSSCSAPADSDVIRVQRTAEVLDGGAAMRDGGQVCLHERRAEIELNGCWDVRLQPGEADPQHDYLIWTFTGGARPQGRTQIRQIKVHLSGVGAEVVGWEPTRDFDVNQTGPVDRKYQRPDLTVPYRIDVAPGHVHPYIDDSLFYVTWSGKAVSRQSELGAVVVWAVPEGRPGFKAEASLEPLTS